VFTGGECDAAVFTLGHFENLQMCLKHDADNPPPYPSRVVGLPQSPRRR
jgi:hypothetical protein